MRLVAHHIRVGLIVRRYEGECLREETLHWLEGLAERVTLETPAGRLLCDVKSAEGDFGIDLRLAWSVETGVHHQCAVGLCFEVGNWSTSHYAWMAGAVYAGNRFTVRRQPYSPRYPEADAGPGAETIITDIPHLEKGPGRSRIQLLLGDLSAPAMGYADEAGGQGLYLATPVIDRSDLFELAESDDRSSARFVCLRGGVREGRWSFKEMRSDAASGDRAPDLHPGDEVHQEVMIAVPGQGTLEDLFQRHFDWMMGEKRLPQPWIRRPGLSLAEGFRIIEEKYNLENWDGAHELYATTCDAHSPHYYQTGWCGGGIADSALLCGELALSRHRAETALNRLCREGQLPSGFFHGKRQRDGKWIHDFAFDQKRPYTHRWNLLRRQGDLLFYLLKAARREGSTAQAESVRLWTTAALRLADALCELWARHGQMGQFIDAETGDILVGGSTSGGIVPAGLVLAHKVSGEARYLDAAIAIGTYYLEGFTRRGLSTGGPADACQAPDSESCYALLESYVCLYEETGDDVWKEAATAQAVQFASWVMPYDFPFPEESEFGRLEIPTTGSVVANAQNGHAAPGICTHSGESLLRLSRITGDARFGQLLAWIGTQLPWNLSRAERPIHDPSGRPLPPGWINERVNTSDWDDNVGGVFYGSTWSEVALMLMTVEVGDEALTGIRGCEA